MYIFFIIFLFFFFAEWQDTLLHRMRSVSICSYKKQILTRIMCQGKFVPHEWTLNSISPHHRLIARTEYFMWQAFYIVFSAGFWFENSFFLIDDRGYRPGMLNCKEILSPYLLKFWLSVVICTYKYMYNIVIGFFFIEIMKLGRVASMISDMILFMTDQSSPHICWVEFIVIYGLLKCEQTWEFV